MSQSLIDINIPSIESFNNNNMLKNGGGGYAYPGMARPGSLYTSKWYLYNKFLVPFP